MNFFKLKLREAYLASRAGCFSEDAHQQTLALPRGPKGRKTGNPSALPVLRSAVTGRTSDARRSIEPACARRSAWKRSRLAVCGAGAAVSDAGNWNFGPRIGRSVCRAIACV